ncbi:hypothetical protein LCER1_G008624 [Lachnellula cervina]|uniref:2EXR domain-containing protein n=1 Tax=Lachnellula cervina TaxID=1316786 RepID=A0A7D8YZN3_9HELO|nr:hypothetical protein LCER1_G008624 [Lachnellula cervina]
MNSQITQMTADKTYERRKTTDIRAFCVSRGLLSKAGRKINYQHRLEAYSKKKLDSIKPCLYFKELPAEIRIKIWEYSLPGPRALCPGYPLEPEREKYTRRRSLAYGCYEDPPPEVHIAYDQTSLFFPKDQQPPKPAALDVCRESRYIALQRYRLVFGTTNIYADLDTDILYFGPAYTGSLGNAGKLWGWVEPALDNYLRVPAPVVVADLLSVKRVGYRYTGGWAGYDLPQGGGRQLRGEFIPWKGLKEILLSHEPEDIPSYKEPGYVDFAYLEGWEAKECPPIPVQTCDRDDFPLASAFDSLLQLSDDKTKVSSSDDISSEAETYNDPSEDDNSPRRLAERTMSSFKTEPVQKSWRGRELPAVNLIIARRVPNIPAFIPKKTMVV